MCFGLCPANIEEQIVNFPAIFSQKGTIKILKADLLQHTVIKLIMTALMKSFNLMIKKILWNELQA